MTDDFSTNVALHTTSVVYLAHAVWRGFLPPSSDLSTADSRKPGGDRIVPAYISASSYRGAVASLASVASVATYTRCPNPCYLGQGRQRFRVTSGVLVGGRICRRPRYLEYIFYLPTEYLTSLADTAFTAKIVRIMLESEPFCKAELLLTLPSRACVTWTSDRSRANRASAFQRKVQGRLCYTVPCSAQQVKHYASLNPHRVHFTVVCSPNPIIVRTGSWITQLTRSHRRRRGRHASGWRIWELICRAFTENLTHRVFDSIYSLHNTAVNVAREAHRKALELGGMEAKSLGMLLRNGGQAVDGIAESRLLEATGNSRQPKPKCFIFAYLGVRTNSE